MTNMRVTEGCGEHVPAQELVERYQARARQAISLEEKKTWLLQVADLQGGELNEASAAKATYELILDLDPFDSKVHESLHQLQNSHEAEVEADAESEENEIEMLEQLLQRPALRPTAARLLEPAYRQHQEFGKLVSVLESYLEDERDPIARLKIFREIMQIHAEELNQPPIAFLAACRAFRENPSDEPLRLELERQALASNSAEELAMVYEEAWQNTEAPEDGIFLVRRLAWLKENHLDEKTGAIALWHRVLAGNPADEQALLALERLNREREDWPELVEILELRIVQVRDLSERVEMLTELRDLYQNQIGDSDLAFGAAARAFRESPVESSLREYLEQLALEHGKVEALLGVFLDVAEDQEGNELGSFLQNEIDRIRAYCQDESQELSPEAPIEIPEEPASMAGLLCEADCDPSDAGGVAVLEKLLARRAPGHDVVLTLIPVCRKLGQVDKVIPFVESSLGKTKEREARRQLLLELINIYEQDLEQKPQAFATACRAFEENIGDEQIMTALERLARETGSLEDLAAVYQEALQASDDRQQPDLDLLRNLARLYDNDLQQPEQASKLWNRLLYCQPQDPEALMAMERLYRQGGNFTELVAVMRRMVKGEQNPERKKDLNYELATVLEEQLGLFKEAIEAYLDILADDPEDLTAAKLLNRLCNSSGNYDALLQRGSQSLQ